MGVGRERRMAENVCVGVGREVTNWGILVFALYDLVKLDASIDERNIYFPTCIALYPTSASGT